MQRDIRKKLKYGPDQLFDASGYFSSRLDFIVLLWEIDVKLLDFNAMYEKEDDAGSNIREIQFYWGAQASPTTF